MADRPPPSAAAIAIGTAIVSVVVGYYLGQAQAIGLFGGSSGSARAPGTEKDDDLSAEEDETDEEDDDENDAPTGNLKTFADSQEECKLVFAVRTDLGMTKGKIAAQCSHATLACYKTLFNADPAHPILRRWEHLGQAKIALKVESEDEMLVLQAQAVSLGICAKVIHDAGRTQIASGSATVLGIGPAPKSQIDQVTGHLKLL